MFYNPQLTVDRIDAQIAELNKLKTQVPSVQPITQNFQLAPQNVMRYANNIEEVNKEYVTGDTPFFTKDLSVLWIKSQNGSVRSYELKEIIEKDEKDLQIEFLQAQINEMREKYEFNGNTNEPVKNEKSTTSKSNTKSDDE